MAKAPDHIITAYKGEDRAWPRRMLGVASALLFFTLVATSTIFWGTLFSYLDNIGSNDRAAYTQMVSVVEERERARDMARALMDARIATDDGIIREYTKDTRHAQQVYRDAADAHTREAETLLNQTAANRGQLLRDGALRNATEARDTARAALTEFSKNRLGRFRESGLLRHVFEQTVARCIAEGLVGGDHFAVDASLIQADVNKCRSLEAKGWDPASIDP